MPHKRKTIKGFTLIELALVVAVLGLLIVPLANMMRQTRAASVAGGNKAALEVAREALLAYAVQHKGCLPHAADFEGGVPDTDIAGDGGIYTDTGSVRQAAEPAGGNAGQRAGDIPWADLQLGNIGRDANGYRIQYYVASAYTSPTQTRAGADNPATRDDCAARLRPTTESWDSTARYAAGDVIVQNGLYYAATAATIAGTAPPAAPWAPFGNAGLLPTWDAATAYTTGNYVTSDAVTYRALADSTNAQPASSPAIWRAVGVAGQRQPYPAWQSGTYQRGEIVEHNSRLYRVTVASTAAVPPAVGWQEITLPAAGSTILESRIGPVITTAPGSTSTSPFNVFVLIAAGTDRTNAALGNRPAMRDANHNSCSGATCTGWTTLNDGNVDTRTFSLTPAADASPDVTLAVSFADYQAALARHNLNAQAVGW